MSERAERRADGMVLFYCGSVFHIVNAINIKYNLHPDDKADIILADYTDLSRFVEPLQNCGLFESVQTVPYRAFVERSQGRPYYVSNYDIKKPHDFIGALKFNGDYSDYYCFVSAIYDKIIYYAMIKKGIKPKVYIAEEGLSIYVMDMMRKSSSNEYDKKVYGKYAYADNVCGLLLYEPDLYCGNDAFAAHQMPKLDVTNKKMIDTFTGIFGHLDFPQERYIFLEEAFLNDRVLASDKIVMKQIAEFVGIDNIIVKLHPRNGTDSWKPCGFKTLGVTDVPWEISLLANDIRGKVFLTVSSTSSLNGLMLMNKESKVILLYKLMSVGLSVHVKEKKFKDFIAKVVEKYNDNEPQVFIPPKFPTLQEYITYLERW